MSEKTRKTRELKNFVLVVALYGDTVEESLAEAIPRAILVDRYCMVGEVCAISDPEYIGVKCQRAYIPSRLRNGLAFKRIILGAESYNAVRHYKHGSIINEDLARLNGKENQEEEEQQQEEAKQKEEEAKQEEEKRAKQNGTNT